MKTVEIDNSVPLNAQPPLSLDEFMRQSGLSASTCWRYRTRGWLTTCVIANRHYIQREELARFNARAAAGEFAGTIPNPSASKKKKPATAAARAVKERMAISDRATQDEW